MSFNSARRQEGPRQGSLPFSADAVRGLHLLVLAVDDAVSRRGGGHFSPRTPHWIQYTTWAMRIYMAGIFAMGFQIACQQSFMALGQAKVSLLLACLRKIILLIPLIFILPHVLPDAVFGVFLAEPVSDILAATITTITFFARFDKILDPRCRKRFDFFLYGICRLAMPLAVLGKP